MKKKLVAFLCILGMVSSMTACGGNSSSAAATEAPAGNEATEAPAGTETPEAAAYDSSDIQGSIEAALAATDGKIAIITNTLSQNEEEYRSAEAMVEKYGDRIIHDTMPDNFMTEQEQFISVVSKVCSDTDVKAVIINQACPGSDASIDKVLETRDADDLLVIFCTPQENADDIVQRADIVLSIDEINKGGAMAEQAYNMGCKTFVHYSFPRHMAQAPLSGCRDQIKAKCEELGMTFVDATAPDPTSDAGVSGAQMFILEDVPKMVDQYGKETAFFATNCSMQVPLIEAVAEAGAYYPMPCCPSPYHGFPSALGIESPEDLVNGLQTTIDAIGSKLSEKGLDGHFSTWSVPASIANTVASTEYAFLWMAGMVEDCEPDVMSELLGEYCNTEVDIVNYEDPETGNSFDNYLVYQQGFLTFGELAGPAE
ncbi:MAG: DUF3798 domain-containing protein [Clostridiales bacterium]|nr:DUF3798 domain-containing protein [Clostridiales bacterium]